MAVRHLYDVNGNEVTPQQVQERSIWYAKGRKIEDVFVERYGRMLDVRINPAKKTKPWQPDLLHGKNVADLKCQNTPFFMADKLGVDANYAVTFNLKDAMAYGSHGMGYKNMSIYFWIDWIAVRMEQGACVYKVQPLHGVWIIPLAVLELLCQTAPIWWYRDRQRVPEDDGPEASRLLRFERRLATVGGAWGIRGKAGNAACSYVLDVRTMLRVAPLEQLLPNEDAMELETLFDGI